MDSDDDYSPAFVRYPQRKSIDKLSQRLNLATDPYMQDWEVELADGTRASEFVAAYDAADLDDDDRFALMALVIASVDDAIDQGFDIAKTWSRVVQLLRRDGRLHASTMKYWSCGDDPDPDHQFSVTPFIRPVWRQVRSEL